MQRVDFSTKLHNRYTVSIFTIYNALPDCSAIWSNTYCCPNSKHWK